MTSIYSADPVYYTNGPSVRVGYTYRAGSVMDFCYKHSPVFALCLQKSAHDKWADSEDFNATCFVPSTLYSQKNLAHFRDVSPPIARDLSLTSIIENRVDIEHLRGAELLPTYKQSYINIMTDACGGVRVNGLPIRQSIQCDNGVVHVLDGFISLTENYLD
jgi:predicted transposase YbfD/YdcC